MYGLIQLVTALPLFGFVFLGFFGNKIKKEPLIGSIACAAVGIPFIILLYLFCSFVSGNFNVPFIVPVFDWISVGTMHFGFGYQIDQLSLLFGMIVTGVGFFIHLYSIGYMHGDKSFFRFFSYMNLFIFMMLNLVLADNFLVTFFGWEGVGLCSYLLIGFWYDKKFEGVRLTWTGDAGNKAFITNRIGDAGFLIGLFMVYITFGTLNYADVASAANASASSLYNTGIITAMTLMFFLACTGKSAQLPLAVWLPDAMAGPTSVSALIHAATMVTSGIFLIARNSVLFALAPDTMTVVTVIGILTAFTAASVALTQNDIKKVLAYSTVSQLGFMFAAMGAGGFSTGVFHVMTHAFFKGLLFLAAGGIIHAMHEEQNIKKMGGLKKYMPITNFTFLIAALAISGIPFFAGFFSKDEILWNVYETYGILPWLILVVSALFTAFYIFRLYRLVFLGKERFDVDKVKPKEAPATMTIPLIVLAVCSALGGFLGIPNVLGSWFSSSPSLIGNFLNPIFTDAHNIINSNHGGMIQEPSAMLELLFMLISVCIAVLGIYMAKKYYADGTLERPKKLAKNMPGLYSLLFHKYRLDEFYFVAIIDVIVNFSRNFLWKKFDAKGIDGIVNGTGTTTMFVADNTRKIQTGYLQKYAMLMTAGIIAFLLVFIIL